MPFYVQANVYVNFCCFEEHIFPSQDATRLGDESLREQFPLCKLDSLNIKVVLLKQISSWCHSCMLYLLFSFIPLFRFEDGTVSFLDIIALKHGFDVLEKLTGQLI